MAIVYVAKMKIEQSINDREARGAWYAYMANAPAALRRESLNLVSSIKSAFSLRYSLSVYGGAVELV